MEFTFYGKYATGEMSFAPSMVAFSSNLQKLKCLAVDTEEHVGVVTKLTRIVLMIRCNALVQ